MERDLLSRVTGDSGRQRLQGQDQDPRPPPSPTLSLRLRTEEERQRRAADDTSRGYGYEPQQEQAAAPANVALPVSSSVPFVVPGYPMSERRHNLRAGAGARSQAAPAPAQRASPAPQRPPMAPVPTLQQLAGPTPTVTGPGQERCGACGVSARLLQGVSGDLDRARAQVALLTCQNESLRCRLKRASAAAAPEGPAAPAASLSLRCRACRVRPATVVLVPREHLCLCGHCTKYSRHNNAAVACLVCRGAVSTWLTVTETTPR